MATRFNLTPYGAEFADTDFPQLQTIHTTERRAVLSFDTTTRESCMWTVFLPDDWSTASAPVGLVYYAMASATSGGVAVDIEVEAITASDAVDLDAATSYDTVNGANDATVPGTAGFLNTISVTLTNHDSSAANDMARIRLSRDVADAADTAAGDMHIFGVRIADAA